MKIGLTLPSFVTDPDVPLVVARAAEAAGLDGVFVYDHLFRRAPSGVRRPRRFPKSRRFPQSRVCPYPRRFQRRSPCRDGNRPAPCTR